MQRSTSCPGPESATASFTWSTGDRSIGAEVAQDAFLRAWRALDTLRDPLVFGGWLLRIARNAALNRRRSEVRATAVDAEGMAMMISSTLFRFTIFWSCAVPPSTGTP